MLLYSLDHHLSIASAVGFIALAGVAAEFGVVMLIYLKHAIARFTPAASAKSPPRSTELAVPAPLR